VPFVIVALALFLAGVEARADSLGELQKAHSAYVAQRYEDAEARLRALLDPKSGGLSDPGTIADARMYLGAVLVAEGRREEAEAVFEQLLLDQPEYSEDPLRIRQDAINTFIDVRSRLRERLARTVEQNVKQAALEKAKQEADQQRAALRLATLEQLASEQVIIERHSRWIALLPFGVGQFQNGQNALGATFLAGEALLAAGSVVATSLGLRDEGHYGSVQHANDDAVVQLENRVKSEVLVGQIFAGSFLFVAVAGVVHAQITFVPERVEIRKRPIPPLSLAPSIGPGTLGIVGTF